MGAQAWRRGVAHMAAAALNITPVTTTLPRLFRLGLIHGFVRVERVFGE